MKKRIAFISVHASPLTSTGDADCRRQRVYLSELTAQLLKQGYEIDIFTRRESAELEDVVAYKPGIRVIQVHAGSLEILPKEALLEYVEPFCLQVSDFVRRQEPGYDLVHANAFLSGLVAMDLKKRFGIPYVVTFHALGKFTKVGKEQDRYSVDRTTIEEQIARKADAIIAGSPEEKNDYIQYYKADSRKIFIIPYGFNPAAFYRANKVEARAALQLDPAEQIVLHEGGVTRHTGADTVIKAMALLGAGNRQIRLLVVKDNDAYLDPEAQFESIRLKNLAANLGVSRQVTFVTRDETEPLSAYYSAADLLVSMEWQGSLRGSPVEAMACGTPVISVDDGLMKFSILDGKTGFLVPSADPKALIDRIGLLLDNQALLEQMSTVAVQHANTCFPWGVIAGQVHNLYEYILLNQLRKAEITLPARIRGLNSTLPLRNLYLRRNIEPKYSR
jgi:D-inositol-3-phosphate glycosyltransferase